VGHRSIARGTRTYVWEGTYHGKKVSIKRLRAHLNNDKTLRKVRSRGCTSLSRPLKNACGLGAAVILQTGRHLEKVKTPEYCPVHRRYNRPFANHLGVGAEQNPEGIHSEKPRHKSNQPGVFFPEIALDR